MKVAANSDISIQSNFGRLFHRLWFSVATLVMAISPLVAMPFTASALSEPTITPSSGSINGGETVTVAGGARATFTQVVSGGYSASGYALASDGSVYAWGSNNNGQLGNGTTSSSLVPVAVTTAGTPMAGKVIVQIAGDTGSGYALASDGSVYAWGSNNNGQLGNGTTSSSLVPVAVTTAGTPMAGKVIVQIAGGTGSGYALASDGSVYAWGSNNNGQLGNGTTTNSSVPVAVTTSGTPMAGKTITQVASTGNFATVLALASDGRVYAWGYNSRGQLGNGTTADSLVPVAVTTAGTPMAGKTITQVATGDLSSYALASDGSIFAWGSNSYGQFGNGTTVSSLVPVAVPVAGTPMAEKTIIQIAASTWDTGYALAADGSIYAWGYGGNGQLGNGTTADSLVPVAVTTAGTPMAGKTIQIATGNSGAAYALAYDGSIFAWGYNGEGELGNGTTTDSSLPVTVTMPPNRSPTSITFGGIAITNFEVTPAGDITFNAPARMAGSADLVIAFADSGTSMTVADAYTYVNPPASFAVGAPNTGFINKSPSTLPGTIIGAVSLAATLLTLAWNLKHQQRS